MKKSGKRSNIEAGADVTRTYGRVKGWMKKYVGRKTRNILKHSV